MRTYTAIYMQEQCLARRFLEGVEAILLGRTSMTGTSRPGLEEVHALSLLG